MFVYLVRRPKEWSKYKTLTKNKDRFLSKQTVENACSLESVWNGLFDIEYVEFRKKLNKIREYNLKKTKFKYIINSFEDKKIPILLNKSNSLLYCTDDDDWCHDDIIDIVESKKLDKYESYRWCYFKYCPNELPILKEKTHPPYFSYQTNNYILSTPLKFNYQQHKQIEHVNIDKIYKNSSKELFINEILSIHNKNLSSISLYNKNSITKRNLINLLTKAKDPPPKESIPYVFHKYVDQMIEMYKKIKIKKINKFL